MRLAHTKQYRQTLASNKELVYQFIVLLRRTMNQENCMDRFDDLQTFVLVADRQSIRQAADMLGRAPSAVSRA
ncbi:MAG: hypothetical protein ACJA0Z_004668 [Halioglobus sp.]|jgi:hypothetical protein